MNDAFGLTSQEAFMHMSWLPAALPPLDSLDSLKMGMQVEQPLIAVSSPTPPSRRAVSQGGLS